MTIENASEARTLFERSSKSLVEILESVERAARGNRRFVKFDGWPSDEVIAELERRGFRVDLSDVLIPDTRISW